MFPEALPEALIKLYTYEGETVLDPFLGSGTTIKVASNLHRNSIGYEINKAYLDIIKAKINYQKTSDFEIIVRGDMSE
jgi:DNA modification methylase